MVGGQWPVGGRWFCNTPYDLNLVKIYFVTGSSISLRGDVKLINSHEVFTVQKKSDYIFLTTDNVTIACALTSGENLWTISIRDWYFPKSR